MNLLICRVLASTVIGLAGSPATGLAAPAPTPHGFADILGEAIAQVTLRPDQEAVVGYLSTEIAPLQARVDAVEDALADQVEAGRTDRDALDPLVSACVGARLEVSPQIRRIIEDLRSILDPDQRADVAAVLDRVVLDVLSGESIDDLAKAIGLKPDQVARVEEGLASLEPALRAQRALLRTILEAFRGEGSAIEP